MCNRIYMNMWTLLSRWPALILLVLAIFGSACSPATRAGEKTYPLKGTVMALDEKERLATIKHETIPGWMEAMTMKFPVRSDAEWKKLRAGDEIRATVYVRDLDYHIGDVQVTAR